MIFNIDGVCMCAGLFCTPLLVIRPECPFQEGIARMIYTLINTLVLCTISKLYSGLMFAHFDIYHNTGWHAVYLHRNSSFFPLKFKRSFFNGTSANRAEQEAAH